MFSRSNPFQKKVGDVAQAAVAVVSLYSNNDVAYAFDTMKDTKKNLMAIYRLAAPIPPLALAIASLAIVLALIDLDYQNFKLKKAISEVKGIMAELQHLNLYTLEFHRVLMELFPSLKDGRDKTRILKLMETPLRELFHRELDNYTQRLLMMMRGSELQTLIRMTQSTPEEITMEKSIDSRPDIGTLAMQELERRRVRKISETVYDGFIYAGTLFADNPLSELEKMLNSAANLHGILESKHNILVQYIQYAAPDLY